MKTFLIVSGLVVVVLFAGYCIALHADEKANKRKDYDEDLF